MDQSSSTYGDSRTEERVIKLVVFVDSETHSAAELSAMLGVVPDESWEIGAPFRFGTREFLHDTSSWAVVERAVGDEDYRAPADRLIARLQAFVPQFQALPVGVEVSLRILVDEISGVFRFGLDRPHVKFAEAIGADIDVSVAVYMSVEDLERDLATAKELRERLKSR
jgi:hypothetical protein